MYKTLKFALAKSSVVNTSAMGPNKYNIQQSLTVLVIMFNRSEIDFKK